MTPGGGDARSRRISFLITRRVIVFLLAGAVVNVAVAWGCAFSADNYRIGASHDYSTISVGDRTTAAWLGYICEEDSEVNVLRRFGVTLRHIPIVDEEFWEDIRKWTQAGFRMTFVLPGVVHKASGLPFRAMECGIGDDRTDWSMTITRGQEDRFIPLRPLWPGFAINTMFYAAILWLLFAAPGFMRKRVRIKRGSCARCGYPWGAGALCSECGSPIIGRSAVHGASPPATPAPDAELSL